MSPFPLYTFIVWVEKTLHFWGCSCCRHFSNFFNLCVSNCLSFWDLTAVCVSNVFLIHWFLTDMIFIQGTLGAFWSYVLSHILIGSTLALALIHSIVIVIQPWSLIFKSSGTFLIFSMVLCIWWFYWYLTQNQILISEFFRLFRSYLFLIYLSKHKCSDVISV
jgi:hypothetical protein